MNLSLLAALLFLQSPEPQAACQAGQIVVDADGHCCWPGQAWKRRGCHGKPYCPPGLVADRRDHCVPAPQPAPAPQPQTYNPYPDVPQPVPQPQTYNPYPDAPQAPSPTFAGVPARPAVPVRFTAARPGDAYEVEVLVSGMPSCKTPCELLLPPDRYKLRVSGSAHFSEKLSVLDRPMNLQIERSSGGWKAFGAVSVAVGGAAFVGGLAAGWLIFLSTSLGDRLEPYPADPYWARKRNQALLACGGVSLVGAVLAVTGGVIGFKKAGHTGIRPVKETAALPAPAPEAPAVEPAAEPPNARRNEPPIELLAVGAAPTENGVQVGAVFAF